ncbi:MAG: 50S ribosomal protein L25/general stress protein Ctc [Alphaproteobacteria bacterium]|jgi:large subunit ribosomal protein L25|nr:50S ribosomal protein L25/general stress protein Ctc [Rhodospirillaceae bacterium]MDP6019798.1 50S ribosomal protein L25/general stress protein Ctc [Alphaproteobacteria bacterium]MDP6255382.1 50S ribosomal protein L25/general stress protein Ctc [Alphaproteobacteria bacterium]MDP7053470.1 50S ribosomal protein L25/general stress protein Ctc [Alphaproteobacteria bacterium]MDP7229557.1 50S ribosomal protein L25/general stress protein Ctc [Alphaproteobacteria bacterium]|tara:strand:+ start:2138 stop:2812 length:675 start_codon:yes stop_codon:yes gene_type:complete
MSDNTITVEIRDRVGKGAARAARRTGVVPGVVYGDKKPPQPITVDRKQMDKLLQNPGLFNTLFELHAGDRKQQVLPRDVQLDVVTDVPLHVDFLRLSNTTEITISIPVVFVNEEESEALRQGAVLNIVRHQIEVRCLASAIPSSIEVDLAGSEIGDSIHISAVPLPAGVVPTITDRDFTIVTLAAPTIQAVEEELGEDEEGEEGMEGVEGEEGAEESAEGDEEE